MSDRPSTTEGAQLAPGATLTAQRPQAGTGQPEGTYEGLRALADAPLRWRPDRRVWERICPHGIGHSADDHGCDGCCQGEAI